MGVSCTVNLIDAEPTEEQISLFSDMIRLMREDQTEFLIFEFQNAANKPGQQQGLVFYQICREEGKIHAEIRIDYADGFRMYAESLEDGEAANLLRQLIRTRTAPDVSGWKDITERVIACRDEDFE